MRTRRQIETVFAILMIGVSTRFSLAQGGPPPTPVRVGTVDEQTLVERRLVTGDIMAVKRSLVAAREPGLVAQMTVEEGHAVKQGDALVQLDDSKLQIQLEEARYQIEAAQAAVEQHTALVAQAERDERLLKEAADRSAANPKEVLDAQSQLIAARARLTAAQHQQRVATTWVEMYEQRIKDMHITAPFDGVVVAKHTEMGQWISEGDAVVEIVSSGAVEAWLNVPQRYLSAVRSASNSPVNIDADGILADAAYDRLIPQMNPRARTFTLVVRLPNENLQMAPGMSVTGWVPTGEKGKHLTVPKDAVLRNEAGAYVYVVRKGTADGPPSVQAEQVRILYPSGNRFVIEAMGLRAGDEVVTEGNERLFPGAPVSPVRNESATTANNNNKEGAGSNP